MSKKGMNRRQFLQTSSLAIAGAAVAGSTGAIFDPNKAWAIPTTTLDQHTAMTLVKMCRHLYPHNEIGDSYYTKIVEEFDEKAKAGPDFAKLLQDGVASLDAVYQVKWLDLSGGYKLKALKSIETTPFFQAVRGAIVTGLYNQLLVWRYFGYEGSSWKFGGYLNRGFNDIAWLPEE
jgi:hypothetical protein